MDHPVKIAAPRRESKSEKPIPAIERLYLMAASISEKVRATSPPVATETPSCRAICDSEKMSAHHMLGVHDQRVLPSGAAQRLEHVADARGGHVRERDHLDLLCGDHDVGDGELVAAHAALGRDAHGALAEEVGRGDHAEHVLALVDHKKQPHAARDHELVRARERRLRADRRRRGAPQVGHHSSAGDSSETLPAWRLRRAPEARARAELSDRQRVVLAVHRGAP